MERFSEKVFLSLTMPTEEENLSDAGRISLALQTLGYENVTVPLSVLRSLYPMCRNANFDITATLVYQGTQWVVVKVEPGDTTMYHYGLCVDYGSTTIIMELVDLTSGAVIGREKEVNGQTAYGTDILTRITYALEDPAHMDDLQSATLQTFEKLLALLTEQTGIDAAKLGAKDNLFHNVETWTLVR